MTSTSSNLESDVTDLTLETTTDRDFALERFIGDYMEQDEISRDERDLWQDANSRTVVKLPPIRCSKYTVIGNPSMEKRRQFRQEHDDGSVWMQPEFQPETRQRPTQTLRITTTVHRPKRSNKGKKSTLQQSIGVVNEAPQQVHEKVKASQKTAKAKVVLKKIPPAGPQNLPGTRTTPSQKTIPPAKKAMSARLPTVLGEKSARNLNSMNRNTLFDTGNFRKLYLKIAQPQGSTMPGPLECSPRFQDLHLEVEPQLLQEKMMVLGDYLQTTKFQRYRQDRAVIPTGFDMAFRSKTFTRHYVTAMYVDEHEKKLQREETRPSCIRRELSKCHFCDVIGNKYCKSCIENKNKWFGAIIERRPLPLSCKSLSLP